MGSNRETNLQDDDGALEAYRQNFQSAARIGSADQFASVQGAARILTRRGEFDAALATLQRAKIDQLNGFWRHSLQLALVDTLAAAGRTEEATQTCRSILADELASATHRREAQKRIEQLNQHRR